MGRSRAERRGPSLPALCSSQRPSFSGPGWGVWPRAGPPCTGPRPLSGEAAVLLGQTPLAPPSSH